MLYFIYIWHARTYVHVYITIYIRSKCRFVSSKLVFSLYVYNFIWAYVQLYLSFWKFSKAWLSTLNCHIGMSSATYAKYRAGKYFSLMSYYPIAGLQAQDKCMVSVSNLFHNKSMILRNIWEYINISKSKKRKIYMYHFCY